MFILSETLVLHFLIKHHLSMRGLGHLGDLFGALYTTPHLHPGNAAAKLLADLHLEIGPREVRRPVDRVDPLTIDVDM